MDTATLTRTQIVDLARRAPVRGPNRLPRLIRCTTRYTHGLGTDDFNFHPEDLALAKRYARIIQDELGGLVKVSLKWVTT